MRKDALVEGHEGFQRNPLLVALLGRRLHEVVAWIVAIGEVVLVSKARGGREEASKNYTIKRKALSFAHSRTHARTHTLTLKRLTSTCLTILADMFWPFCLFVLFVFFLQG